MPSLLLEGDTLGEKRRHFNKLVADAVATNHYELTPISDTDNDIDNLLKIEIACKARNVDYVIEVMKSKDMLYAATAIKKSTWLITDPQYANIINPEYLHTQLKPYMTTKAFNKLLLHIRLNLKDETRVEAFYEHFKKARNADKWLQNCSIPFIENAISFCVSIWLFKRLIKKSAHFLTFDTIIEGGRHKRQPAYLSMLKSRTADVLDILEDTSRKLFIVEMGKKRSEFLMKTCPQRVLENIEMYRCTIDMSIVARYMNKNEIKKFLCEKGSTMGYYQDYKILINFIKNMREEERVNFIQKSFIDRTETLIDKNDMSFIDSSIRTYQWYEFYPFDIAFPKMSNLIRKEISPSERCAMLSVLISSAKTDTKHMKSLLTFVVEKHMNIPFKFKIDFVNNLLSNVSTHKLDEATWNILDQIFHSMDVYTESENDVQLCLEAIIVRKVLNDEPVPEVVEQKCTFSSYKNVIKTLSEEEKSKLFNYVLNCMMAKAKRAGFANEPAFRETLHVIENVLTLLKDFNKTLNDFPLVIEKIQELVKTKEENKWTTDISCLYNVNKSWRKYMFEESLSLSLCEETCLNALKHKPQLLTRHDKQIHTLRTNDTVSLRRVLAKLRVYWPDSLARHWADAYMECLNQPTGHAAVIKGLFVVLSRNQIIDFAKKYVPENFKINWGLTDHTDINIRTNIAKYLHLARPLVPLDTILWYANGDYVRYAIQSYIEIWSTLSEVDSLKNLPKLYHAPVSLLKFVLKQAFLKLNTTEVINVFWKIWKSTKNSAVKSIIFGHTSYEMQTYYDNETVQNELWKLLNMFIDDLLIEDGSTEICKTLTNFYSIPYEKRPEYFMKISRYLMSLPDSENFLYELLYFGFNHMDSFDEDFVVNLLLSPVETRFFSSRTWMIYCFVNFLLYGKSEENQLERFKKIAPAFDKVFQNWYKLSSSKENFESFLLTATRHLVTDYGKVIPLPTNLFAEIESKMVNGLSVLENYKMLTSWRLITAYVKIIKLNKQSLEEENVGHYNDWDISLLFSPIILQYLKEDTDKYGPMIHHLFAAALDEMFKMLFIRESVIAETLRHVLIDDDFLPAYLVVSKIMPKLPSDETKCARSEIFQKIKSNESISVHVQFNNDFREYVED
ncbi:uncharacterized protein LOC111359975 isoform X4 [Spodoptera litura]|uniref:Uncharacterized protein LOC111359975 isoform X4 n=1 Tax=Spodoptera litura TaxID=69820 RepID=A0A9J7EP06_SPOLT|nr:uncharacterized protein LOC111359975 isoform X4 [Spodoptera litura]